jgi:hypothetical protein
MRHAWWVAVVLAACSSKGKSAAPASDAQGVAKAAPDAVAASGAELWFVRAPDNAPLAGDDVPRPKVTVLVQASGISVLPTPEMLDDFRPDAIMEAERNVTLDQLVQQVLAQEQTAGGATADDAKAKLEDLAEPTDDTDGGVVVSSGEGTGSGTSAPYVVEADITIANAERLDAELPPATPLILATADAPAVLVAKVVAKVGGVIAVAKDGTVKLLRVGFPWVDGTYGGAEDRDDDVDGATLDAEVSATGVTYAHDGETPTTNLAEARARYPGPAPTVVDVLVDGSAHASDLVSALAVLDAADITRLGLAPSPF